MSYKISVVIEKDEYGYYSYCPELEGCQSQGDTFDEVLANIKEAIEAYISTLSQEEKQQILLSAKRTIVINRSVLSKYCKPTLDCFFSLDRPRS